MKFRFILGFLLLLLFSTNTFAEPYESSKFPSKEILEKCINNLGAKANAQTRGFGITTPKFSYLSFKDNDNSNYDAFFSAGGGIIGIKVIKMDDNRWLLEMSDKVWTLIEN